MKKVTMADVAERAGVSKSTVSQFINNRYEYMAEATKLRVEEAIEDLGYVPNYIAKSLRQKKTSTVGVIVANILHAFSTEIIRSIEDECEHNGFHLFVCNADDQPEKERAYIDMLVAKQVDGLIIFPTNGNEDYYEQLKRSRFPIVFMDRKIDHTFYPTVLLDNEAAASLAVAELVRGGHQKIGMVSNSVENKVTPRLERISGFRDAALKHGIEVVEEWIIADQVPNIKDRLENVWEKPERPTAFFAANDLALIELMKFAKQEGLRIPEDIAMIAIDDSPFLEIAQTPITVIRQPTFEMGKAAAEMLFNLIQGGRIDTVCEEIRFAPELVKRNSI